MGAMLFGQPNKDQLQFNEETFWAGGYRGVQTRVDERYLNPAMSEFINGYMSTGNLFVEFDMPADAAVKNYYRDLNLDDAVAHVRYEYGGVRYEREYFASYPRQVLVARYTASQAGAISCAVRPVSMHPGAVAVTGGEITMSGRLKDSEPYDRGGNAAWSQPSDLDYCIKVRVLTEGGTSVDGASGVYIEGADAVTVLISAATDYDASRFVLNADGSVDMAQTPFKSARGVQAAVDKATRRIQAGAAASYDALKAEHIADYRSLYGAVTFSLGESASGASDDSDDSDGSSGAVCTTPTDELQASYAAVVDAQEAADGRTRVTYTGKKQYAALNHHLEALYFNYARYLLIASSRALTTPAHLQGKWCQSTAELWGSCYCININLEMNYWFAGGAALYDCLRSLPRWLKTQLPAAQVTARNQYGVTPASYRYEDGRIVFTPSSDERDAVLILHVKQALMGTTDQTGSLDIQSAGNTAWLMYNLWDYYMTSRDDAVLRDELYPIMRAVANFYTQYLYAHQKRQSDDRTRYPDGYYYTTWEGASPEHGARGEGIKYDLQLVAGMYDYTICAAETLGADADKVRAWKEIRDHLEAPVELGDEGQIKEWKEETTYNTDASGKPIGEGVHRHISHLVGLYPGMLITRDTPELLEGARRVLVRRGDSSTGWSCANKFLLWARALDGDKALELFRYQLAQRTYANLFDFHAPFQIDGNFGAAAGVLELLMQSQTGTVYLLPALPAAWKDGAISGIRAKNGATVSIRWQNGSAVTVSVTPARTGDLALGYRAGARFTLDGSDARFDERGFYTIAQAQAGTTYTLHFAAE